MRGIIKRGRTHDAPRSGRPTRITKAVRKTAEGVTDDFPRLPLCDITQKRRMSCFQVRGPRARRTLAIARSTKSSKRPDFKLIKPEEKTVLAKGTESEAT